MRKKYGIRRHNCKLPVRPEEARFLRRLEG